MKIQENASLAPLTSFDVGGPADKLITIETSQETARALASADNQPVWPLGYGTNVLISDEGLRGAVLLFRSKQLIWDGDTVVADAGAWWDELVQQSIQRGLWGLELTSGIPGSVGAAVFINITAYGQAQSDCLEWVEYLDEQGRLKRLDARKSPWDYKQSVFQDHENWLVVRAAYKLSNRPTAEITYQSALDVAEEHKLDPGQLDQRRAIILEARERVGSIFIPGGNYAKTVGSFFRNPVVKPEQAEAIMAFDESGKTREQIKAMNQAHGGLATRVSAAHVMLAAGFKRGQTWGKVRLHPKSLLKIENTGGATAQDIYGVVQEIIDTTRQKLDITLEPEARILGRFN